MTAGYVSPYLPTPKQWICKSTDQVSSVITNYNKSVDPIT